MSKLVPVHPYGWPPPRGYTNGLIAPAGRRLLAVAGQIGWDTAGKLAQPTPDAPAEDAVVCQFAQALRNVMAVVTAAGGNAEDVISLRIYVTDKHRYAAHSKQIGVAYRAVFGGHYPAMALVQVADLLENGALVEIEALATLP